MSNIYRKLIRFITNGWAWFLDYCYVAYWQVYGFTFRINPATYSVLDEGHKKAPIILIPGIYENWQFMKPVADSLHNAGHPIYIIQGLGYNTGDVDKMAALIDVFVNEHNLNNCIIVAHSKGGLIGKYLLTSLNSKNSFKGMVALNTPFSGSLYAYLMPLKSTRIFIPNSPILSLLTANTEVNKNITSIYGIFDPHIPKGSFLEGAHNVQLQTKGHFRVMKQPAVHEAILQAVTKFESIQ